MQRYFDDVTDELGNAVPNAMITVRRKSDDGLAVIYSDNGATPKQNPFYTNQQGEFDFYAANGRYRITVSGAGVDSEDKDDVVLFDIADASIDDLSGISRAGAENNDLLVYVEATQQYEPKTPLEAGLDQFFARVNARTDGWFWLRRNAADPNAAMDVTQQGGGRIINFRKGPDDGAVVAYITNDGGAEFGGAVVINGDLTVKGAVTQVDSNEVNIGDNIIVLNSEETGAPTLNAGIEIERGTEANVSIRWNETSDRWEWQSPDGAWHRMITTDIGYTFTATQRFQNVVLLQGYRLHGTRADNTWATIAFFDTPASRVNVGSTVDELRLNASDLDAYEFFTNAGDRVRPFQWLPKTANYTAKDGDKILADSSTAPFTITLPASPRVGASVTIVDAGGAAATNNITIARNGANIQGVADDMALDVNGATIELIYYNTSRGWVLRQT